MDDAHKDDPGTEGCECESNRAPDIDFSTFVLSLATSALYHLGASAGPDVKVGAVNLPLARQVIDILGILKAKTTGNLDPDERQILDALLFDLRMKFVEVCRRTGNPEEEQ